MLLSLVSFFFFNDTATTEIYTLSLHDALPIYSGLSAVLNSVRSLRRSALRACSCRTIILRDYHPSSPRPRSCSLSRRTDRKSTRLNSSHSQISYAVFCLKKKKKKNTIKHNKKK